MQDTAKLFTPTGKEKLDYYLQGGYDKKGLTVITGKRGVGKTKFVLESALKSSQEGTATLLIMAENTIQANIEFLLYIYGEEFMQNQQLDNLHLAELNKPSIDQIEEVVNKNKTSNNIEAVFIDSLTFLTFVQRQTVDISHSTASVLFKLERISKRYDISIIIEKRTSTLNEFGEDLYPTLMNSLNKDEEVFVTNLIGLHSVKTNTDNESDQFKESTMEVLVLKSKGNTKTQTYNETYKFVGDIIQYNRSKEKSI